MMWVSLWTGVGVRAGQSNAAHLGNQRGENSQPLPAFLAGKPVRLDRRRGDQARVEPQVRKKQGRGGEGREGEVERGEAGLEGPEGLPGEGFVCAVAGLLGGGGGHVRG
jgi:hypothetical protein